LSRHELGTIKGFGFTESGSMALLVDQTVDRMKKVVEHNFTTVRSFYQGRLASHPEIGFRPEDLDRISISIVLYYLYTYNSWRVQYRKPKYENLDFKDQDFDFAFTNDIIFRYFKNEYLKDWKIKCSVLLHMGLDELEKYYQERQKYENK
jgi:hypothetical protein